MDALFIVAATKAQADDICRLHRLFRWRFVEDVTTLNGQHFPTVLLAGAYWCHPHWLGIKAALRMHDATLLSIQPLRDLL